MRNLAPLRSACIGHDRARCTSRPGQPVSPCRSPGVTRHGAVSLALALAACQSAPGTAGIAPDGSAFPPNATMATRALVGAPSLTTVGPYGSFADINLDGEVDLFRVAGGMLSLSLQDANGAFRLANAIQVYSTNVQVSYDGSYCEPFGSKINLVDITEDGVVDVIYNGYTRCYDAYGGSYTEGDAGVYFGDSRGQIRDDIFGYLYPNTFFYSLGDTDGIFGDELAVIYDEDPNHLEPRPPEGLTFTTNGEPSTPRYEAHVPFLDNPDLMAIRPGDANGDGLNDYVVSATATEPMRWRPGYLYLAPPRPDVPFEGIPIWTPPELGYTTALAGSEAYGVGDLDGDGTDDLAIPMNDGTSRIALLYGSPWGYELEPRQYLVGDPADLLEGGVTAGDFDGDGIREVVVSATGWGGDAMLARYVPERFPAHVYVPPVAVYSDTRPSTLATIPGLGPRTADDLVVQSTAKRFPEPTCANGAPAPGWYLDADGDGYASQTHVVLTCTAPANAQPAPGPDCDDANAAAYPGAPEPPQVGDRNCDGVFLGTRDLDGDGFPGPVTEIRGYLIPDQYPGGRTDCDDTNPNARPFAPEPIGAEVDLNCDGLRQCNPDLDRDGFGDSVQMLPWADCDGASQAGAVGDCDDAAADIFPGAPEPAMSPVDFDCDGQQRCIHDNDGDGTGAFLNLVPFGDCVASVQALGDCDDHDPSIEPGAPEPTLGVDSNCDGWVQCNTDIDQDGFGTGIHVRSADYGCIRPNEPTSEGDCDDRNPFTFPGAREVPGGGDNDCDGLDACFLDIDGDGIGAGAAVPGAPFCAGPSEVARPGDCDDGDPAVALTCPGVCFLDLDGDGYGGAPVQPAPPTCQGPGLTLTHGDCDDSDPEVRPGTWERSEDIIDNNCDGQVRCWADMDSDGIAGRVSVIDRNVDEGCGILGNPDLLDCDDGDPNMYQGAPEAAGDGDLDCDGYQSCNVDDDSDGYGILETRNASVDCPHTNNGLPAHDCDDTTRRVSPADAEIWGNRVDEDCDGFDPFRIEHFINLPGGVRTVNLRVSGADPGALMRLYQSANGGSAPCLSLNGQTTCGDLRSPTLLLQGVADANGQLITSFPWPGGRLRVQAFSPMDGLVGVTEVVTP